MEAKNDSIEDLWDRIHQWMKKHEPRMLNLLNPGATEEQLKSLQASLNLISELPEDFKASYRIHNGSSANMFFGSAMVNSFHSVEDIVVNWTKIKDTPNNNVVSKRKADDYDEIQNVVYLDSWIPFGNDGYGNTICIDLLPTYVGTYGQVIQWFKNKDLPILCATSFTEFMRTFTVDVENAQYVLSGDGKNLVFAEIND